MKSTYGGAIAVIVGSLLVSAPSAVAADSSETGRYQAISIEMGGPTNVIGVLLVDTRDGHIWRYWMGAITGGGSGEGVKYLMQLRPGTKLGETVWSDIHR